jgi:vacuolar-type H+-ATPase subunit I/STV1
VLCACADARYFSYRCTTCNRAHAQYISLKSLVDGIDISAGLIGDLEFAKTNATKKHAAALEAASALATVEHAAALESLMDKNGTLETSLKNLQMFSDAQGAVIGNCNKTIEKGDAASILMASDHTAEIESLKTDAAAASVKAAAEIESLKTDAAAASVKAAAEIEGLKTDAAAASGKAAAEIERLKTNAAAEREKAVAVLMEQTVKYQTEVNTVNDQHRLKLSNLNEQKAKLFKDRHSLTLEKTEYEKNRQEMVEKSKSAGAKIADDLKRIADQSARVKAVFEMLRPLASALTAAMESETV